MLRNIFKLIAFSSFFLIVTFGYSQKNNHVGLNYTSEWTSKQNIRNGLGITYERQITKHSGLETGLYWRTLKQDYLTAINAESYHVSIIENYASVPLLYKFYSNILNLSAGPTFDYFIGWREKSENANSKVTSYKINPSHYFGFMFKASKRILIMDHFAIEPELRYNPQFKYSRYYFGIGIAAKYQF